MVDRRFSRGTLRQLFGLRLEPGDCLCEPLPIFHAGSMAGVQLQIANDAIGGQPNDTSNDIIGLGVGCLDSKAPQERWIDLVQGAGRRFGVVEPQTSGG